MSIPFLFLICSVKVCVLHLSGPSGRPAAKPVGVEGDTEKPSMSSFVNPRTFAPWIGLKKVYAKHLANLTLINMVAQVSYVYNKERRFYHCIWKDFKSNVIISLLSLSFSLFLSLSIPLSPPLTYPPPLPHLSLSLLPSPLSPLCPLDGLDLYPINPLNPAIFAEERNYMCGHWLVEYEKIHNGTYMHVHNQFIIMTTW